METEYIMKHHTQRDREEKLRTYRLFKREYGTESYILCIHPKLQRSA